VIGQAEMKIPNSLPPRSSTVTVKCCGGAGVDDIELVLEGSAEHILDAGSHVMCRRARWWQRHRYSNYNGSKGELWAKEMTCVF
jgi:hypothetical protein